jgi:hypothetical protein
MKTMKTIAIMTAVLMMLSGTASAQPSTRTRPLSPVVGWLGVTTMFVGGALMVPWPQGENYTIYGSDVCILSGPSSFDVQDGACSTMRPRIKAGLITAGIGAAVALVGFHKVTVAPQISRQTIGATAHVTW